MNPFSANFGRIRIGNTRVDVWGGFQPLVRLYAQLLSGKFVGSTTGKEFSLKKGGFGASTRYDILMNFARSKAAPIPGFVASYLDQQDVTGQPFRWRDQWKLFVPMAIGDISDAYREALKSGASTPQAIAAGAGAEALSAIGIGVQSYSGRSANDAAELIKDSKKFGLGMPPKEAIEQAKRKAELDSDTLDLDWQSRLEKVTEAYVQTYGTGSGIVRHARHPRNKGEAESITSDMRERLFRDYYRWHQKVMHEEDKAVDGSH
jgi:hypothetical protein